MNWKNGIRLLILTLGSAIILGMSKQVTYLGGFLTHPVARLSVILLSPFLRVSLQGDTILVNGSSLRVIPACTPVPEMEFMFLYIGLTWRGRKDLIAVILTPAVLFFFDSLRIAIAVLLLSKGYPWWIAHDLNSYLTFVMAFLLIAYVRNRMVPKKGRTSKLL